MWQDRYQLRVSFMALVGFGDNEAPDPTPSHFFQGMLRHRTYSHGSNKKQGKGNTLLWQVPQGFEFNFIFNI